MDLKELLLFMLIGLSGALAANHYLEMDIEFLNNIEDRIIRSGERGASSVRNIEGRGVDSTSQRSPECERLVKSLGDAINVTRADLATAKKGDDQSSIQSLKSRLDDLIRRQKEACR